MATISAGKVPLERVRNIGIFAHIDAWKTTFTERVLYYTGKQHKIWETHDGEWTMDWMEQEKERGITITSAATTCFWLDHQINIIDTPWHVDFTVEVERALRVLDGGIAVFDGAAWVEPQSETVWRQATKYSVPRLCFFNKMDKMWADFKMSLNSLHERLSDKAVAIQIPWWEAETFKWVIDLRKMKAYTFEWDYGKDIIEQEIPEELQNMAEEYRDIMLDSLSMFDDELAELYMEWEEISEEIIDRAIRNWTLQMELFPVFVWSALKNVGVQFVLDAVVKYLPSPIDIGDTVGTDPKTGEEIRRKPDIGEPVAALAFKVATDPFVWTLTYVRVYSWSIKSWDSLLNPITWKKERIWRLLLMHANKREEINEISAGHICAFLGLKETKTGHTLCDSKFPIVLESMEFPEPVISLAIEPKTKKDQEKLGVALSRLADEDPSFRYYTDEETLQTIIAGMGELHLDIIVDRLKREYKVEVNTGAPQVAYRETVKGTAVGEGKFVRQTGGRGQYGHVIAELSLSEKEFEFENAIVWGIIPREFIPAVEKWAKETFEKWVLAGYPVINVKFKVFDGSYHEVDSSEVAFKVATARAIQDAFKKAGADILEPIMKVEVIVPDDYVGNVIGDISSRRGRIETQENRWRDTVVRAFVPLAEMFGYATDLRSNTQGRGNYTMVFDHYEPVPENIKQQIIKERAGKFKSIADEE